MFQPSNDLAVRYREYLVLPFSRFDPVIAILEKTFDYPAVIVINRELAHRLNSGDFIKG